MLQSVQLILAREKDNSNLLSTGDPRALLNRRVRLHL